MGLWEATATFRVEAESELAARKAARLIIRHGQILGGRLAEDNGWRFTNIDVVPQAVEIEVPPKEDTK